MATGSCTIGPSCERRPFWATQIDGCAAIEDCAGGECAAPALRFIDTAQGRTIDTSNVVTGLALNILLTDARQEDTACGYLPGRRGGHWSEAFIAGGNSARIGSRVRQTSTTGTIQQQTNLAEAYAKADLEKLVTYGVATRVDVTSKYAGRGVVDIFATIWGSSGEIGRVGVQGSRAPNGWMWSAAA